MKMNGDAAAGELRLRQKKAGNGAENSGDDKYNCHKSPLSEDDKIFMEKAKAEMLHERMHEIGQSLVNDLNNGFNNMVAELAQRLGVQAPTQNGFTKEHAESSTSKQKDGKSGEKVFVTRNSYLTDLLEIDHFRTIYNIFLVMLIVLFLSSAMHDYLETGTLQVGIKTIQMAFGNFSTAVQIWLFMLTTTFATYLGFSVWAQKRADLLSNSKSTKIVDYGFLLAFLAHQIYFIYWPGKNILKERLAPASSLMIGMEQVRMLMKTHAFVRTNTSRVLSEKRKFGDRRESSCPEFSKFLYFMFAPTLIYRDEYPRTFRIRWSLAFWNLAEIILMIFYAAFIFERFILPPFDDLSSRIFEPLNVILYILEITLPSLILFCFGFYCILHSSQNAMAEILRFGDRLFYKDWWNCSSYVTYYRLWNIIVQDWLHAYIYKDVHRLTGNKSLAMLSTFLTSALFHEYILGMSFRFFYPVMFTLFAVIGLFFFVLMQHYPNVKGNVFMWFSLSVGNGILFALYVMEWYARGYCRPYDSPVWDVLLPRSWICHRNGILA